MTKKMKNYNLQLKRTPAKMSLDVAIVRSHHVMIGDKAAKEMWGVPKRLGKIRGTLLEDDSFELEGVMHLCLIFVSHKPTPIHKDCFWNILHPNTNVRSIHDHDKTTIPHSEHKCDLICRIIRGEVDNDNQDADYDYHDKDDVSKVSNDKSICNNNSEGNLYKESIMTTPMVTSRIKRALQG